MARRSYSGNARATTLSGGISAAATSITVADGTGYPDGSGGSFVITIDSGNAAEEKVLCTARVGNTLTAGTRGWDGTTASAHDNGAAVAHTYSATDADEANAFVNHGGTLTASGAAATPLVVKGAASQTANLLEAQDSAGTALGYFTSGGSLVLPGTVLAASSGESATHGYSLGLFASAAARVGLVVRGAAGQTANLAEFQNSSGTVLLAVKPDGSLDANGSLFSGTIPSTIIGRIPITVGGTVRYLAIYS